MKKYWAFFKISLQNTVTYRGPILIWLLGNILSLVTIVAVWLSVSGGDTIGGYTKPELISYYIVALFLQWLTGWFPFYGVVEEIQNGEIVLNGLAKPISYFWRKFAEELGWHTFSSVVGMITSLLLALLMAKYVVFALSVVKIVILILTISLAIMVVFSLSLCLGLLTFWFTEIYAIDSLFWAARTILGGQGIPISFIPGFYQTIVRLLPFRYTFSFPLEIYFDKLTQQEIVQGLITQLFWVTTLALLYKLMWNRGRRAYSAFGQ